MIKKTSAKTKIIISLLILITSISILPIKEILLSPSITGMVVARAYIRGAQTNHSCSLTILDGWNLISIPCLAANISTESVLSSIDGNYTSIFAYNKSDIIDPWEAYNPDLPSWAVNDLGSINEKQGYWIFMKNQSLLSVNGTITSPNAVPLAKGWNLIGYPSNTSKNITSALNTISGSYTLIWIYNATYDEYYYYNASELNGSFNVMAPYLGYWINMSNDDELYVT